jgi:prophage tail gpP-like protein
MLNFTKNDSQSDLSGHLDKIKNLSSKIEQKISQKGKDESDSFIDTLSVEELKDMRQVMQAAEYLLTKYQDKRDIQVFLQEFIGIILNASNSVNGLKTELEDLVISAEFALHQIQTLHDDMTENLVFGKVSQTKIDDFKMPSLLSTLTQKAEPVKIEPVKVEMPRTEVSSINLTNSARRVNTGDYLERTAVEI